MIMMRVIRMIMMIITVKKNGTGSHLQIYTINSCDPELGKLILPYPGCWANFPILKMKSCG
jgi:hypothetical protein